MTNITHNKVSMVSDDPDTTLVRPSDWNDEHDVAVVGTSVYDNSGAKAIPASTLTPLTWNQENYDTEGWHSTSLNTSRITVDRTGKYMVTAVVNWDASATDATFNKIQARVNGSGTAAAQTTTPIGAATDTVQNLAFEVALSAGAYIEICAFHNSTTSKNIDTGGTVNRFTVRYLGA